ncbi:MAG: SRPBCC domain-containing protein, partial [Solirubrobacterales bacterium]
MTMTTVGMAAALVLAPVLEEAPPPGKVKTDRTIELSVTLDQPPAEVYRLWTTVEGARTFFAPDARIEGKPGGRYEIIFDPAGDPEGARHGTKGARLLRLVPGKEIAFEWSMPPLGLDQQPLATWVELTLEPAPG